MSHDALGKTYPATVYAVGREKIREYSYAVGESNPLHLDHEAARAAGFADLVAPPMFAVVYAGAAITAPLFDPEIGIDFAHMLHGEQEFSWGPLVVAGDELRTTATFSDHTERGGMGFFALETVSVNQRQETVCTALWTQIVRGSR
jgi:acyl dehydratase